MAFRVIVDDVDAVLPGAGRHPFSLSRRAGPLQGLHLDAEAEQLPLAAHRRDRPGAAAHRDADPHPRDARGRRARRRRALDLQAAAADAPTGRQYRWLRELLDILEHALEPEEFLEHTKLEMFQDQVFCFTPKGDLIALPRGATPVDFAYAVHSQIGDTCVGAKINGRLMPLRTQLAQRRPGRDRHLEGADAVADLGALRRHRQGARPHPPLHPHPAAHAISRSRQGDPAEGVPPGRPGFLREGRSRRC